jgi:hypothetical protein
MKRHRGQYDPEHPAPYELSRSRIENFVRCPACFWLQQVKKVQFPSIPGFNINEATDILLKRVFDKNREHGTPHEFLAKRGYGHLIPFKHENFKLWTQSLHFGAEGRFHTIHEETNLKIGGGLDDVWLNKQNKQLHIVDYKSTSVKKEGKGVTLDDPWKESYKRQMDLYVWVMKRLGFDTSDTGYFLYCDGDRFTETPFLGDDKAVMEFKMSLLPYVVRQSWIEPTLLSIKRILGQKEMPAHSDTCEYGKFLSTLDKINNDTV